MRYCDLIQMKMAQKGMDLRALSKKSKVEYSVLWRIVNSVGRGPQASKMNDKAVTLWNALKIARALGFSADEFYALDMFDPAMHASTMLQAGDSNLKL